MDFLSTVGVQELNSFAELSASYNAVVDKQELLTKGSGYYADYPEQETSCPGLVGTHRKGGITLYGRFFWSGC